MRPKRLSPALYSALTLAALALIFATNAAAVNEKVIHNFIISPHGAFPAGQLLADPAGNLYGATYYGGEHGYGTVFRLTRKPDGKWVETILHSFVQGPLFGPSGDLTFDTSGNLYGTIVEGGNQRCPYGCGMVFELSPTADGKWTYSVIYRFKGKNDADYPNGIVLYAGNLYGTTLNSDNASSIVFELVSSSKGWTEKTIYNFGTTVTLAGLAIDAVGNLYGRLYHGQYTSIFQLVRRRDGKWEKNILCGNCMVRGIPVFDQTGNLYIGAHDRVLELVRKQNWQRITIAEFSGRDGSEATGALTFDESGNLYGTTQNGGDLGTCLPRGIGCGTVFKLTRGKNGEWEHTVLYRFKGERDGAAPYGMIFDNHGNLYGTTPSGGDLACGDYNSTPGCGTVFELAPTSGGDWEYSLIYPFGIGKDGGGPSGLVADASGNLYGALSESPGCGSAYKLTPSPHGGWKEQVLYQFKCGVDGAYPLSSLIFDSAGNLYGTTLQGGRISSNACGGNGCGTVFQPSPSSSGGWTERVIYSFTGHADGYFPAAGLVLDAAGNVYGTTEYGGGGLCRLIPPTIGCGVVYELSPTSGGSWTETTLHTFTGAFPNGSLPDGAFPIATLIFYQAEIYTERPQKAALDLALTSGAIPAAAPSSSCHRPPADGLRTSSTISPIHPIPPVSRWTRRETSTERQPVVRRPPIARTAAARSTNSARTPGGVGPQRYCTILAVSQPTGNFPMAPSPSTNQTTYMARRRAVAPRRARPAEAAAAALSFSCRPPAAAGRKAYFTVLPVLTRTVRTH
jgi:uncharacterized repeat protein (TIGR03803 family)